MNMIETFCQEYNISQKITAIKRANKRTFANIIKTNLYRSAAKANDLSFFKLKTQACSTVTK